MYLLTRYEECIQHLLLAYYLLFNRIILSLSHAIEKPAKIHQITAFKENA